MREISESELEFKIDIDQAIEKFKNFFTSNDKYIDEINTIIIQRRKSICIDFPDLILYDKELADMLVEHPKEIIYAASEALRQIILEKDPEFAKSVKTFHARFRKLAESIPLRKLRSCYIGKLIMIEGIVTRETPPRHFLKKMVFKCDNCGFEVDVPQYYAVPTQPPRKCIRCGGVLKLVQEKCEYVDWQKIIVQEKPEELPPGQLPRSVEVILTDDLVDVVKPGDRVYVVGVLDINAFELKRTKPPVLSSYIEANYVEAQQKEFAEVEITPEDQRIIEELARDPRIRERIIKSIAPSIYGLEEVKEAIACLLFGGVSKVYPDGVRVRGDLHVLLIGDPGTGKSQLLRFVARIAPRAVYTTGKGSSAAGLTAAVVKDKLTGEFYLEAGALVLADMGVCIIDEIDKMDAKDRVAMHEALEQQTISIAKAGIVATLNARCAVLAAANPAFGRYLPNRTVAENVDLPVTLLSRFDLIFIIRDQPMLEHDKKVAEHVTTLHSGELPPEFRDIIPPDLLRKYIAYARKYVKPRWTKEAKDIIMQFYINLRAKSSDPNSPIAITARQLEALIRLAEAEAKMRLSPLVEREDAERAIMLFEKFLKSVGIDVETGKIDIDIIMTGKPRSKQEKFAILRDIIAKLEEANGGKPVKIEDVIKEAENAGLDRQTVEQMLNLMIKNGDLYMPKHGYIKRVST